MSGASERSRGPERGAGVAAKEQESQQLWRRFEEARAAGDSPAEERYRNELMERYYPLVRHIAERVSMTLPRSVEVDDLISAGVFGLMDALRMFDPARGVKFKTYSSLRIRGAIIDSLRSSDWVPRAVRLKAGKVDRALQKLRGDFGREPTHTELAKALNVDHDQLAGELDASAVRSMHSLSEMWEDGEELDVAPTVNVLEDRRAADPFDEAYQRDVMRYLLTTLTSKERFIIEQYYDVGHTMREIGEMLSVTESRVCQLHANIIGRLKARLTRAEASPLQGVG